MFRKHQDEFGEICYAIRTGQAPQLRPYHCSTTPGGGKSMLPIIAASQLIPGFAERICWVVPRRSLQSQAEAEFLKPRIREMLGHNHSVVAAPTNPIRVAAFPALPRLIRLSAPATRICATNSRDAATCLCSMSRITSKKAAPGKRLWHRL
jgi:hypothetical protein